MERNGLKKSEKYAPILISNEKEERWNADRY